MHIRLGNLMQLQGRIAIAIEEFQTAMQIRKTICESSDKYDYFLLCLNIFGLNRIHMME